MSKTDSTLGVSILVGLLIIVLVSAIPVIAAEQTMFDSDHAVETMDDEDVSAKTTVAFQTKLSKTIHEALETDPSVDQQSDPLLTDEQITEIAETSITEGYVGPEMTGQIERTYEYIHGGREDVALVFDLREPKQQAIAMADAAEREARAERGPGVTSPEAVPDDHLVIGSYLADEFPSEQNITTGGAPPSEIETAAAASGMIGILVWLFPALAVVLVGMIYYVNRSGHRTGEATGAAFIAAGLLGLIGSFGGGPVARSLAEGRLTLENPEFASLSDAVVAMVGNLFGLMRLQSGVLLVGGVLVLGVVYVSEHGYFGAFAGGDEYPEQPGPTAQEQREQYREPTNRRDQYTGMDQSGYDSDDSAAADREYTGAGDQSTADREYVGTDSQPAAADQTGSVDDQDTTVDRAVGGTDRSAGDESRTDDRYSTGAVESRRDESLADESQTGEGQDGTGTYDPDQYDEHGFKRDTAEKSDSETDGDG